MSTEPTILSTPPIAPATPPTPPTATPPAAPVAEPPEPEALTLARLETACVRGGLLDEHADVARGLLKPWLKEQKVAASPENLGRFVEHLRKTKPALFQAPPTNTAPVPSWGAAPAAPPAGRMESASSTWQALRAAGRAAEAEAFYKRNRTAILRGQ